jgi:hypothetical protein
MSSPYSSSNSERTKYVQCACFADSFLDPLVGRGNGLVSLARESCLLQCLSAPLLTLDPVALRSDPGWSLTEQDILDHRPEKLSGMTSSTCQISHIYSVVCGGEGVSFGSFFGVTYLPFTPSLVFLLFTHEFLTYLNPKPRQSFQHTKLVTLLCPTFDMPI